MASSSSSSLPPVLSHPNISTLVSHSGIPVIDLSKPYSKQLIVRACEEFCFFKIINHGVPMEFITMLESEAVKSFSLPLSEKEKAGHANTLGYGNKNIGKNGDVCWVEYLLLNANTKSNSQRLVSLFAHNLEEFW
ncbi:unnamed protein product [Prunus brigantina]